MRRLALIAAASLGLGVAVIVDQPASFADCIAPKTSEMKPGGNLAHTDLRSVKWSRKDLSGAYLRGAYLRYADLRGAILSGADLSHANLGQAKLMGVRATNLRGCPERLPSGWVCKNNSLIQR